MRRDDFELETKVNENNTENLWFNRASSVARFVGQRVPEFASAITRTAFNIIAELDELEKLSTMTELQSDSETCEKKQSPDSERANKSTSSDREKVARLPWELLFEEKSIIFRDDEELKTQILALSLNEENFLTPFSCDQKENEDAGLIGNDSKRLIINKLYQHDGNLCMIHSKLIGKSLHALFLSLACIGIMMHH